MVTDTLKATQEVITQAVTAQQTPDLYDAYTALITSQQATYNIIIMVILGLVSLFALYNFYLNRKKMEKIIEERVKEEIEKQKEIITKEIITETETEIVKIKANVFTTLTMIFADKSYETKNPSEKVILLGFAIKNSSLAAFYNITNGTESTGRGNIDWIIKFLDHIKSKNLIDEFKIIAKQNSIYEDIEKLIEVIPDALNKEKLELTNLVTQIKATSLVPTEATAEATPE